MGNDGRRGFQTEMSPKASCLSTTVCQSGQPLIPPPRKMVSPCFGLIALGATITSIIHVSPVVGRLKIITMQNEKSQFTNQYKTAHRGARVNLLKSYFVV
jgi:hypothetical protein